MILDIIAIVALIIIVIIDLVWLILNKNKNIKQVIYFVLTLICIALAIFMIVDKNKILNKKDIETDSVNCTLDQVIQINEEVYETSFDGIKHDFIVCLPENYDNAPLVLMLHGYGESAEGFRQKTTFEKEANERGFAVVYVTGAPNLEDKTSSNGWNSGIGKSSNKDVEFLRELSIYLCDTYNLDKERIYAVGFSNGAFMTHRLAMEANDVFAGVVSVAGMMPESIWEEKTNDCKINIFQITGEKDDVVPKNKDGSAKYSNAPAIEDVIAYYVDSNDLTLSETTTIGKKSVLSTYTSEDSSIKVWNLDIPDGRHSWPDEKITGINTNKLILDFLEGKDYIDINQLNDISDEYFTDMPEAYKEILKNCLYIIAECEDGFFEYDDRLGNLSWFADSILHFDKEAKFAYSITDLNKDGIDELLILCDNYYPAYYVMDIYTLDNDKAVNLAQAYHQSRWYINSDGLIINDQVSNPAYRSVSVYSYDSDSIRFKGIYNIHNKYLEDSFEVGLYEGSTYEDAKLIETFSDSYDLNELWKKYDEILAGYTKDTYQFDLFYFKDIMPLRCDNP